MKFTLSWLYPYWRAHATRMMIILLFGLISACLQTVTPYLIENIVNGLAAHLTHDYILKNVFYILGTGLLLYITNMVAQRNRAYMNMKIEWEIREKVFRHIVRLDSSFYHRFTNGDLVTRLADDISRKISWFSCSGVFRFVQAVLTLIALLTVMILLNLKLTLWVLLPVPFIVLFSLKGGKMLSERYTSLQQSITDIYDFLETCFTGIRLIKANSKEESQKTIFTDKAENQKEREISVAKVDVLFHFFFHSSGFLSVAIVYIVGGLMIINGESSLGQLVAFQFYSVMIVPPLMDISQFVVAGKRAGVSIRRVDALLNFMSNLTFDKNVNAVKDRIKEIQFNNVSLKSEDGLCYVLKNITFKAVSGQRIAIVGKIGCGKSTLITLILRMLEHNEGDILINGEDIRKLDLTSYRNHIGFTSQEAVIFTGTIKDNILMDRKDIPHDTLNRTIEIAQLKHDLFQFPKGIDTFVGTRGFSVSGGQKQRICIARSLLNSPDILLLDDATSAMDANTENNFWRDFKNNYPESICLMATHRIGTIEASDHILVMDNGRIAAQGKHTQLIEESALYREIYEQKKLEQSLSKPQK